MKPLKDERLLAWARKTIQSHPQQEVVIALRGSAFFSLKGIVYPCRPGDVFFMDSGEEHGYPYPPSYPDADHFLIQITRKAVLCRTYSLRAGRELALRPARPLQGGAVATAILEECLTRLRRTPTLPRRFQRHQLITVLRFVVGEIVMQGFEAEPDGSASREAFRKQMVATVQAHIQDTSGKGVSLAGLSALTSYSRHHLLRLFRSFTGQTIHGYIDTVRLLKVKELLSAGVSKKEISAHLGFSCAAAFSRWLRLRFRPMPPLSPRGPSP